MEKEIEKILNRICINGFRYSYDGVSFQITYKDLYWTEFKINMNCSAIEARKKLYENVYAAWHKFNVDDFCRENRYEVFCNQGTYFRKERDQYFLEDESNVVETRLFLLSSELFVSDETEHYS